ncbi:DNA (cytosine-5-)-methyltransferase [Psychrobacillus sp. OK032]|uniref:DNA (cytosine-5-)-methyltransferase n=1 Tax=Psychrobacillus sp. OK032 TaxID=1884358 RepID=UPI0008D7AED0|nr:DNA (cytosine-5-)-methyltransferase [Psychrobacillus sp. OK032]SER87719.1 DNA (cytosine-5)-methyltransferase 1 [Psychrobacillus sp. OK032]
MSEIIKLGFITNDKYQNRVHDTFGIMPAIACGNQGGKRPGGLIAVNVNESKTKGERKMSQTNEVSYEGKPFNYVSLFSGIGGFETALNRLGGNCVLASEIDKFANQSYAALYGEPTAGDITAIAAEDVPDHDVLVGGFPCQAFSVAGKRLGFDDTRGTLFFEVARLAKTKQPRAILLENVKGLVGHDGGKTLDVIVSTLNDIGYHVDFNVLNSKYFGVPQNRERIFIVALRDDIVEPSEWIIEGTNVVAKGKRRISGYADTKTFNFDWPEQTEVTTRLRDVLEASVDEKYYLSEEKTAALVAQLEDRGQDEPTVFDVSQIGHEGKARMYQGVAPTITAREYKEPRMVGHIDLKGHDAIKRVYDADHISPTLTTMGGGHREPKIAEEQGLPIREATKQGYAMAAVGDAVNFQFPDSNTRRGRVGKQIANTLEASNINQGVVEQTPVKYNRKDGIGDEQDVAVCLSASDWRGLNRNQTQNAVLEAEEVRPVLTPDRLEKRQNGRRFKDNDEESSTLTAQDKHGVAISVLGNTNPSGRGMNGQVFDIDAGLAPTLTTNKGEGIKVADAPRYRIRKLTPLECWRLQGFTDEQHQTVVDAGLSDSQRYKQAGNAVTVNVIQAIGERLLTLLNGK